MKIVWRGTPTPVLEKKASEISVEESDTLDEDSLESTPTPVLEKKASEISVEESDTLDEGSLESIPTPITEVETQNAIKKIIRYTSDGKLAPTSN